MSTKSKSKSKKPTARISTKKPTAGTWKVEKEEKIQLKALAKDERTWKIAGVTFLVVSIFLIISFLSYFFTWKQDFTQLSRGSEILWNSDVKVENLLGKLGGLSAQYFIYRLFGVAAVLICTFFFVIGVNLMWRRKVFSVWRNLKYVTLGMLVVSAILAYLLHDEEFRYGGGVGNVIAHWLVASLGKIGAGAVLALIVIGYFIWQFNPVFSFPKKLKRPVLPADEAAADETMPGEQPVIAVVENATPVDTGTGGAKLVMDTAAEKPKYDIRLINKEPEVHAMEEEEGHERITVLKPTAKRPEPVIETEPEKDAAQELAIPSKIVSKDKPVLDDNLKLEINSGPITPAQPAAPAAEKKKLTSLP